jgi:hypothetical protein
MKPFLVALVCVLTAACSSLDVSEAEPDHSAFAGDPVSEFRFVNFLEWRSVADKKVLLRFDRGRYYVLTLREPCISHTREAERLSLELAISKRLRVNDRVILDGTRCIVDEIRPLDYAAWTAAGAGGGALRPTGQVSGGT